MLCILPLAQSNSGGTGHPGCRPEPGHALRAEMKGSAVLHMRSQHQMSTAFIRKAPNYPLLHTVFHLRQGKQRLLIRKAALSTIALTGAGHPRHRPAFPPSESWSWLAKGRRGCRKHGPRSARGRRPLTNQTERSSVPASRHHCRGRAVPTDGRPQSRQQERCARRAAAPRLPHTQPAAPGSGGWGPQT